MKRTAGFTLIELMIAVIIIGILVGVAIALIPEPTERARRTHAQFALVHMQGRQEALHSVLNTYSDDFDRLGFPGGVSEGGYYQFDFPVAPDSSSYTIRATPIEGAGQDRDSDCQWFTIDHLGRRDAGPGDECWPE